jgi:2-octaprenyl-6-methoxyphenol hydroxylase
VVELRGGERLTADAIVLADGGANLAKVAAFEVREKDYGQSALLGRIQADAAHRHTAYERFTAEGPAALLPSLAPCEYSLVWVAPPAKIAALAALPEPEFLAAFQAHFGRRAGRFVAVAGRRGFPLKLRTLNRRTSGRLAVIGNAAQALHPVAGQGFNLGLRDALHLAGELAGAREDVGAALADYALRRERDVGRTVGFTDSLIGLFDGAHLPSRVLRGIGLAALDIAPAARRLVAERLSFGAPQ